MSDDRIVNIKSIGLIHKDDPGEHGEGTAPRVGVDWEEGITLAALAVGKSVVEIGTGIGLSTKALAVEAISVHTCDVDPWVQNCIWPHLPKNVIGYLHERPHNVTFDMAFIDGSHTYEATLADIAYAKEVVDGLIVVHDAHAPNVAKAIGDSGLKFFIMNTRYGLGLATNAC